MKTLKHKNIKTNSCSRVLMFSCFNEEKGIAALLTIIIVSAATLIMAASASLLGLGELEQGYTAQKGGEALAVAEGCTEEVLRRTRFDSDYSANTTTTLTVANGTCTIFVEQSGTNSTSTVLGAVTDQDSSYNRKIRAMYSYTADGRVVTLDGWEELSD